MSKISFIKSDDRKYNISRSLSLIKSSVISGLKNSKSVVVKPNCVVDDFQLSATHVDALDAVMKFIAPYCKNQITLAEGSGVGDTIEAFKNYNYFSIQEKYGFAVIDLNNDDYENIDLLDRKGDKWKAQVAKTILDADYIISVSPPKTHDEVIYTGCIKNVSVGSLLRPQGSFAARIASKLGFVHNNKANIHQGYEIINKNIAILKKKININLSILDAFSAMQGDGPAHGGEMVAAHWAIASTDSWLADSLACKLMSIDIKDVGYLELLASSNKNIDPFIIGDDWKKSIIKFKLHSNYHKMRQWK